MVMCCMIGNVDTSDGASAPSPYARQKMDQLLGCTKAETSQDRLFWNMPLAFEALLDERVRANDTHIGTVNL